MKEERFSRFFLILCATACFMGCITFGWFFSAEAAELREDLPVVKWKACEPCGFEDRTSSLKRIIANVKERTNGKFDIAFFGPELGDWEEVYELSTRGVVDFVLGNMSTAFDPRWNVGFLPYLCATYEEVKEVFGPGGFIDGKFAIWAEENQLKWLGTWVQGFGGVSLSARPATTPEEANGIKVRIPGMPIYECYVSKLGFIPSTVPFAETPNAIATGVVDGQFGGGPFQAWNIVRDLNKYWVWYRDMLEAEGYWTNLDSWKALPPEYQKILEEETLKEAVARLDSAEEQDELYIKKLEEYGWTCVDIADYPEKLERSRNACRECWKMMDDLVGKELMDEIRAYFGIKEQ